MNPIEIPWDEHDNKHDEYGDRCDGYAFESIIDGNILWIQTCPILITIYATYLGWGMGSPNKAQPLQEVVISNNMSLLCKFQVLHLLLAWDMIFLNFVTVNYGKI